MRIRPFQLLLLCLVALLAACATGPRGVDISRHQIESALARRFPYEARPGGLLIVKVGAPALQLLPEQNRLRLDFAVDASDRIVRSSGHGDLGVSFALRYEPADATLRAADVRVERFELRGVPQALRGPLEAVGGIVGEQALEGTVLHSFRPEDVQRARGWRPGAIRVTPAGVHVELVPPAGG